ncbi:MAG: hypothetical protein Q4F44_07355, partial [Bacteroidales bacterium]|nr:hypothetical protein [Bacteroidales bacterium]
ATHKGRLNIEILPEPSITLHDKTENLAKIQKNSDKSYHKCNNRILRKKRSNNNHRHLPMRKKNQLFQCKLCLLSAILLNLLQIKEKDKLQ